MECLSKTENSIIVCLYDFPSSAEHKRRLVFFSYDESQWGPILFLNLSSNNGTLTKWTKKNKKTVFFVPFE